MPSSFCFSVMILAMIVYDVFNLIQENPMPRPKIVCLCGSTRFYQQYQEVYFQRTCEGDIVLSVGFYPHAQNEAHGGEVGIDADQKQAMDILHLYKIHMADEVFFINVGGYLGSSSLNELLYAFKIGKEITFLEPDKAPSFHFLSDDELPRLGETYPPGSVRVEAYSDSI